MSEGVRLGLCQLVVPACSTRWRSRRLGRIVVEPLPVTIAGSELVSAIGNLLERQDAAHAAMLFVRRENGGPTPRAGPRRADRTAWQVVVGRTNRSLDEVTSLSAAVRSERRTSST